MAAGLALAGLAALWMPTGPDPGDASAIAGPGRAVPLDEPVTRRDSSADADAARLTVAGAHRPEAGGTCPAAWGRLSIAGRESMLCAGAAVWTLTGDTEQLEVAAQAPAAWRLTVERVAGELERVRLDGAGASPYECVRQQCWGLRWPADRAGATELAIDGLRMLATTWVDIEDEEAQISLRLPVPASRAAAARDACGRSGSVRVQDSAGEAGDFCASAEAGFERLDDGARSYRFVDRDRRVLEIMTRDDRTVARVAFDQAACEGADCGHATMVAEADAEDAVGARTFDLDAVRLRGAGGRTLWMSGRITMPSQ